MDTWGREQLQAWLGVRLELPVGPFFDILNGSTRGRQWSNAAARAELRPTAATAGGGASRRINCGTHTRSRAHEGVPLVIIQRQLGHSSLGITSIYLQGIDSAEIIDTVHAGRALMIAVSASSNQDLAERR
jgi:integrase